MQILRKIAEIGIITETFKPYGDDELQRVGVALKAVVDRRFHGSLAIRQLDAGSCNGCELEIHALANAFYDIERYGVHFVASPRHADLLLVTGPIARHMQTAALRTYAAMPHPRWVVAVGGCAVDGGEFGETYATCGAAAKILPVDLTIPGCPPTPVDLMRGLLSLMG